MVAGMWPGCDGISGPSTTIIGSRSRRVRGGFELVDTQLNQVVLRGSVVARDSVTIAEGTFFNTTGEKIDVTQEDWADTVKAP